MKTLTQRGSMERAQRLVRDRVREAHQPISPQQLFRAVQSAAMTEYAFQQALWNLVRDGILEFTDDWRLRSAKNGAQA